jgi:RNA polymerase sigma factor (sigma-70 family)
VVGVDQARREFEELFDKLFEPAVRLAERVVGPDAAEDVAVEAFARTLRAWGKVRNLPYRDAWVLRVTSNAAIDVVRKTRRHPPLPTPVAVSEDDAIALQLTLQAALRALPRRQGQVVLLRYLADLSEEEVAGALGISEGSVKTHARRGLAALRLDLGGGEELHHGG